MREIKFRAWDKENGMYVVQKLYFDEEGNLAMPYHTEEMGVYFMQFTGLKDKNSKEIYEGDIVKYKYISGFDAYDYTNDNKPDLTSKNLVERISEVKFRNGEFYPRENGENCDDGFYSWRNFDFEIIGNIYSSPTLLTQPKE